jgi:asparagine synthase (glutamine-hydrolysing)
MCGICVAWYKQSVDRTAFNTALSALKPRGPDVSTTEFLPTMAIGFNRLHICGDSSLESEEQPFKMSNGDRLVVNGEIFNANELQMKYALELPPGSSDCAVIPALLERGLSLSRVSRLLDGDFAIVWIRKECIQASRDPYGVRPLYCWNEDGNGCFASEIKGLTPIPKETEIQAVAPGTVITYEFESATVREERWHEVPWLKNLFIDDQITTIRRGLRDAVRKRLGTVRGIGACLSGGLDSSLVAAIAKSMIPDTPFHTYSIGMEGSPDLLAAREVAAHIKSIHHERIITPDECLAAIPHVIRAVETFDITTVRASVGNWLLGEFIKQVTPDVKVVLNGDGADELFGGYLYMRAAPDDEEFEHETTRLLSEIHLYDVARSERCMAAHGLESRSPFLDRQLVSAVRGLPTHVLRPTKDRLEKEILRWSFDSLNLMPQAILWRRKEAFSDGISRAENSWFSIAAREGERQESGGDWRFRADSFKYRGGNPPPTPEALWYRELFHTTFGTLAVAAAPVVTPAMWMPRWIEGATDPSARTLTKLYSA